MLLLVWRLLRPRAADAIGDTVTAAAATGGADAVITPVVEPTPQREAWTVADQATRTATAPRLSLELKYAAIAVTIVFLFVVLHATGAFSGVNDTVTDGVNRLAGLGLVGIFLDRAGGEPVDPRADPLHVAAALGRARRRQPRRT